MFLAFSISSVNLHFMSFTHFSIECHCFFLVFCENIGEGISSLSIK